MITGLSATELHSLIAQMPVLPDGHTNALLGTVDDKGAQILVTVKKPGSHWQATGVVRHDWSGNTDVGASVLYSW